MTIQFIFLWASFKTNYENKHLLILAPAVD